MLRDSLRLRSKNFHSVFMTPEDESALSVHLQAMFPTVRFVPEDYWEHFIDLEAHRAKKEEAEARGDWDDIPYVMDDPTNKPFPYYSSLTRSAWGVRVAWIAPENPRYVWLPCLSGVMKGAWEIVNEPPVQLRISGGGFFYPARQEASDDPLPATHGTELILLRGCRIRLTCPAEDEDAWKLMTKVGRVVTKFLKPTSDLIVCDLGTGLPYDLEPGRIHSTWIAPDAAKWGNERRRNYFSDDSPGKEGAAGYKPGTYRFPAGTKLAPPRDVPTFEEWLKAQEEEKKGAN